MPQICHPRNKHWIRVLHISYLKIFLSDFDNGTIIRTGITCNEIPCYMRDSACRWFIVKKAKIF